MKLFELQAFGLDHLTRTERVAPEPGPDEVMVRIRAVSLNFRDQLVVQGKYNPRLKLPRVPISDGAGEIVSVGAEVTAWKPGDRVVIPFFPAWLDGDLSRPRPPARSAATSMVCCANWPSSALTPCCPFRRTSPSSRPRRSPARPSPRGTVFSFRAICSRGRPLLLQGTGGVSLFGLQFGKIVGANVILISSSDAKLERARAMGADHTLNYRTEPEWGKRILEMTGGRGVDLTLEVGGTGTLSQTLRATTTAGHISLIGVLSGIAGDIQIGPFFTRHSPCAASMLDRAQCFTQ